ncbi:DUF3850 domain-containing protein [Ignatzschineria rhizosphaerae]|uniref:DUF3850 domain-containing protein n=1 Tax=Ignatzschineria rhizosphaerae TaxID=2923279 RepID=A0ABY3WYK4_9GAMM|nr:DUF3850 domain-containing protein [Ignatzschineria rhizosphaerae]UNM95697.1 DUF3850 domain-containing protein [Ignatzschineria rhizosphaerae]
MSEGVYTNEAIHYLKVDPIFFKAIQEGKKHFELRKNDRNFKVNDYVILQEFNEKLTGWSIAAQINFILEDYAGLEEGYVILNLNDVKEKIYGFGSI